MESLPEPLKIFVHLKKIIKRPHQKTLSRLHFNRRQSASQRLWNVKFRIRWRRFSRPIEYSKSIIENFRYLIQLGHPAHHFMMESVLDHSIQISIDRGGTFTDVYATCYDDAPREGIRRILEKVLNQKIPRNSKLNTKKIDYIRLSTTVATNSLLERNGSKHALLITKGFKDLLKIGNQSRPKIFDLEIKKPSVLYSQVVEVDERVTLLGYTSDPNYNQSQAQFDKRGNLIQSYDPQKFGLGEILIGKSGEAVRIIKPLDETAVRQGLQKLRDDGFDSIAVVLMHSYTYHDHEVRIGEIAQEIGFSHVSLSSQLLPMIKLVPRGNSSTVDAYLTPILKTYINSFYDGFDDSLKFQSSPNTHATRVEFMRSDGGLTGVESFSGLHSILSGPAGGVVGYALTTYDPNNKVPIIGLDMGGTSTDVSRYDGKYEVVFETTTAGVTVQSPQLDINTVAAGGGSRLFWRNGLFITGPESAGASPGPTCYRKGGPLAVTDANLILGRLVPRYFPKIFGPNEDQELDIETTQIKFEQLRQQINHDLDQHLSLDTVAWGFIKIANETMCRPIRALTEARGYDTSKHILATFGGAGGQHACSIARTLNINRIVIHRHSSILSAYGMALADRVVDMQVPSATLYESQGNKRLELNESLNKLETNARAQLKQEGFSDDRIRIERYLNLKYDGTDTALMILEDLPQNNQYQPLFDYFDAFEKAYQQEFGFLLEEKNLICEDVRVRGIGKSYDTLGDTLTTQLKKTEFKLVSDSTMTKVLQSVYFEGHGRIEDTVVYELDQLKKGNCLKGPAILIDHTQTLVIDPEATVKLLDNHVIIDLEPLAPKQSLIN
ncbi:hypothetical protein O181_036812 [Austropuccinia psidii MF-1]|uniref:5-oxoprolinase n=1 Tax=Austropuccinia psidii MF-1 TaxID=1389203 RepID=A0A9Q3HAA2_9BASI|nr:hypothetical protein [Austropuccinia psidii MF-1]